RADPPPLALGGDGHRAFLSSSDRFGRWAPVRWTNASPTLRTCGGFRADQGPVRTAYRSPRRPRDAFRTAASDRVLQTRRRPRVRGSVRQTLHPASRRGRKGRGETAPARAGVRRLARQVPARDLAQRQPARTGRGVHLDPRVEGLSGLGLVLTPPADRGRVHLLVAQFTHPPVYFCRPKLPEVLAQRFQRDLTRELATSRLVRLLWQRGRPAVLSTRLPLLLFLLVVGGVGRPRRTAGFGLQGLQTRLAHLCPVGVVLGASSLVPSLDLGAHPFTLALPLRHQTAVVELVEQVRLHMGEIADRGRGRGRLTHRH